MAEWQENMVERLARPFLEGIGKRVVVADVDESALLMKPDHSAVLFMPGDVIAPISAAGEDKHSRETAYKVAVVGELFRPENIQLLLDLENRMKERLGASK